MAESDPEADVAPTEAPEKKKKKKKRKRRAADAEQDAPPSSEAEAAKKKDAPPPLPGAGTPEGARLREAHRLFEVGDFAAVRRLCGELERADDAAVRENAQELARRTTVDPVQVVVVLACAAVFAAIVWVWVI